MEVVQFVPQLGTALWNLKVMYDQHVENGNEIKELQSFIQDYDHQIPILRERFQEGGGNVMGIAAFKNLEKDVMEATNKLERWSRNKSFFRLFNSVERMQELGKLHSKVMASVQKSLGIANLSMLLDLQDTQATILESNAELKSLLITSIGAMPGTLPTKVRDEVVEASTLSFADPKFWEDILAAVDNHNAGFSSLIDKNEYEDPITTNLMIDPVVASDGNTYCRWTIIDNNVTTNPFNVDEDLTIVIDNLTFRRGLFEKFPEQAQIFRQRRNEYRSHAFSLKAKGLLGDAVLALHYVLQWDKCDVECVEALEQVQGALKEAKEKYLQPFVGLSNELGNGGPSGSSMHEMVVEPCIDVSEAYKLFPSLSSSIPEVQQRAAYGICQWSARDVKFQSYIIKKGGIPLLAALLPSSCQITQEQLVSILLDISQSSHKRRTMFGTVKRHFQDALEPIAEILKEGSPKAREQAARIFFNLSTSPDRKSIIRNFVAIHALVTSFGVGTLQFQEIATNTVKNLFPDALESIAKILKEGSPKAREQAARVLCILSTSPDRRSVIGKSIAMHALVTLFGNGTVQFQEIASDIVNNLFPGYPKKAFRMHWNLLSLLRSHLHDGHIDALKPIAEILKEGSPKAREEAARVLCILSTSPGRRSIIGKSVAMHALVTLFGNGTIQFQEIATNIVNNLFPDALEPIAEILLKGSFAMREQAARILFNLSMSPERRSVIANSMAMRVLVSLFGEETVQFQQIATNIVNNLLPDALEPIAEILMKGTHDVCEQTARFLFNLSTSSERKSIIANSVAMHALVTLFRTETVQFQQIATNIVNNLLPDALEPIAKILKEGSLNVREQAARILYNLSTSCDKRSVIGKSMAMHSLVTSFDVGTLQCQKIVTATIDNLFPYAQESIADILKEGSPKAREQAARILFKFSTSLDRRSVILKSVAMRALVTSFSDGTLQFQEIVIDTIKNLFPDALEPIAEILMKDSSAVCEQAARILFIFSTSPNRRSDIGKSVAMRALVASFGDGTLQFQQIATDTIINFFPYALEPIAKILKEGSPKASEHAARILCNLSTNPDRKSVIGKSVAMHALVTLFGDGTVQFQQIATDTINNLFPDALEPIAKILKEGSPKAREQTARILFNFSMSSDRRSVIGKSVAMHALVTSFGDGTLQFQQIATDIVNNLFPDALEPIAEILMKGSPKAREQAARILFNLSTSLDRRSFIGKSVAMRALLTSFGNGTQLFQQIAIDIVNNLFPDALEPIAEILMKGSPKVREQAARILFNLSTSPDRRSVIGKSIAIRALVTSFGDGTQLFQQIATDIVNILFPDALEPIAEILMKGSPKVREQVARILFNLSTSPDRRSVIGKSMAIRALVTSFGDGTQLFQQIATDIVNILFPDAQELISNILKEGSPKVREQAAGLLLNLSTSPDNKNV